MNLEHLTDESDCLLQALRTFIIKFKKNLESISYCFDKVKKKIKIVRTSISANKITPTTMFIIISRAFGGATSGRWMYCKICSIFAHANVSILVFMFLFKFVIVNRIYVNVIIDESINT